MIRTSIDPKRIKGFCQISLANRLYMHYGLMQYWMQKPENIRVIGLAYNKVGQPIGTIIILRRRCQSCSANIGVYVHSDYRKNGVGRKLISSALQRIPTEKRHNIYAWKGSIGASRLYEKYNFQSVY